MKKRIKRILRDVRGFTLAELLITILILLMVTSIVAAGIPLAVRAYNRVVDAANAQTLLSTTMAALRDELGKASDVNIKKEEVIVNGEEKDKYSVAFISGKTNLRCKIVSGDSNSSDEDKKSIYMEWYPYDGTEEDGTEEVTSTAPLVSTAAATKGLYVTFDSISFSKDVFTNENLIVKANKEGQERELAKQESFNVRSIRKKNSDKNSNGS